MKRGGVVAVGCATVAKANEIRRVTVEGQVTVFDRISSVDRRLTFPPLERILILITPFIFLL